jgi:hypothetical protein
MLELEGWSQFTQPSRPTAGDGSAVLTEAGTDGTALLQSVPSEQINDGWTVGNCRRQCFRRPPAVTHRPRPSSGGYS